MQLPYPKLFLSMALHIGAALTAFVCIGAVSLGLIAAWELRGYIETRQSTLAEQAADILAEEGEQGLIKWLNSDALIPDDVSLYVLDSNSIDILGRQIPEQYSDFIRDSVIGNSEQSNRNFRPVRLAPQLVSPDGATYAFLLIPKGISLWGSPATALGLIAAAILVIAIVAWLIARAFSRPIRELQLAVRELSSGDTAARVPASIATRKDELGALAADFNAMAEHLNELIEGRENLLREMSHELRSPLARLQAALALAAERDAVEESERARIEQEIARMNHVIGEMLRYSSLDAAAKPRQKLVRIDRLLKKLIEDEDIEARNRGCELILDSAQGLTVVGDPELLNSGFENIVRNAIRYSPTGTSVNITANSRHSLIRVTVMDHGPGVPAEHLENIFEPYFRVSSGNHHPDSTGLGLAIVKRVIERHGGRVTAANQPGSGLSVIVELPAADLR